MGRGEKMSCTKLDSINRNLHILSTYTEGDYPEEFDAASVASATADDIVSAINNHPIHIDSDIPNLNKTAENEKNRKHSKNHIC